MKRMWICGLALTVTCLASNALRGDDIAWRPAQSATSRTDSVAPARPAGVTLRRPVPLVAEPADTTSRSEIGPGAFTPLVPTIRAQQAEEAKDKKAKRPATKSDKADKSDKPEEVPFPPRAVEQPGVEFGCDRPLPELSRNIRRFHLRECGDACTVCPDFCVTDPNLCCPRPPWWGRIYFQGEYLLWWLRGAAYPPLVTTSPLTVPENDRGRIGPNTDILFGNRSISNDAFSGGRATLGFWIDPCKTWAIEATYFQLGERSVNFAIDSSQVPVLARPIRILNLGEIEGREIFATQPTLPGDLLDLRGGIVINAPTRFWGIEGNARRNFIDNCRFRFDVLAGYRYLDLQEGLHIMEDIVTLRDIPGVPIFANDRAFVSDRFDTHNRFHGGQLGTTLEARWRRWSLEGTFKVALGVNQQTVEIADGMTVVRPNGTRTDFNGGLLALPSNIGRHSRDEFAVVPEVNVKLGFQLFKRVKAYVGYDFLYISSVVRPGDQIDRTLDIAQIPNFCSPCPPNTTGQVRPIVPFRTTDFWAQGVNFGLEFKY